MFEVLISGKSENDNKVYQLIAEDSQEELKPNYYFETEDDKQYPITNIDCVVDLLDKREFMTEDELATLFGRIIELCY